MRWISTAFSPENGSWLRKVWLREPSEWILLPKAETEILDQLKLSWWVWVRCLAKRMIKELRETVRF